ncbi:TetR/AcrR family transcriptional regulator [Nocardia sp. NPDC052566]|uniref:TetR/AcrR family transcriptional regulator n=1 Tax=Nocardia sp. NPDC052566 TaxID=3364330 RepID=UPI0037C953C8
MTDMETKRTERQGYHHGDLRNALIGAAAELAETGGPEAVTVRAAARLAGVTPTAAYRHFTNHEQLLGAAQDKAQHELFTAMSMGMNTLGPDAHPALRLDAAGRGYIEFAIREPGLFRTAFCAAPPQAADTQAAPSFGLLSGVIDDLVAVGFLAPEHRQDAEITAWAAVHGLACLIVDGAVAWADEAGRERAITTMLATVERGFATGAQTAVQ